MTMVDVKRTGFGILTSIVILLFLDLLPNLVPDKYVAFRLFGHFYVWPGVGWMIAMFVATFGGAYISKVRFVVPAALLAAGVWIFTIYVLNFIAAAAGQGDLFLSASVNSLGLVFGVVGAVLGAITGAHVAGAFSPDAKH